MSLPKKTPLQDQIDELKQTAIAAEGHPFLPAPARTAIKQAVSVIIAMHEEIANLNAELMNARRDEVRFGAPGLPVLSFHAGADHG